MSPLPGIPRFAPIDPPRECPKLAAGVGDVGGGDAGEAKRADFGRLLGEAGEGDCLMNGLFRTVPIETVDGGQRV